MDQDDASQATQPATQNALDPRRIGQQNSGFSDEDISDILCLLYPITDRASNDVRRLASSPAYRRFTVGRFAADNINSDFYNEDDPRNFGRTAAIGQHAIILRMSSMVKDPSLGFTFGRHAPSCDICFTSDAGRRLSKIHFRIFLNEHQILMVEDMSTNGTVVDDRLLRKNVPKRHQRLIESGSTVKVMMAHHNEDLLFLVRIPRREDEVEMAYLNNVNRYLAKARGYDEDPNKTIGPGPSGHVSYCHKFELSSDNTNGQKVNLFPAPFTKGKAFENSSSSYTALGKTPREFRGSQKYARVGVIGQGAFATVYKVTSKYDGSPYAAKELDKRKFMKNGILDQKVENEMKIMQKVQHENIVQYIEHFDWDAHKFIIIMEFVQMGDLGKTVLEFGSIRELHVKTMAHQLIDAVGYLHDNKITHRDVKPDNILIQSLEPLVVKLTDFGLSKMIETEQTFLKTFCGTLLYCAPEVYNEYASYDDHGRKTQRRNQRVVDRERYDHAVDIWSLGGVLFYALTAKPPFPVKNGTSYTELLDQIMKTPLNTTPLIQSGVSSYGIEVLQRMIHVRPETRATIEELQAHPWLTGQTESFNEAHEGELEYSASQLSLDDRMRSQTTQIGANSPQDPHPDFSMESESEKENYTFGQRTAHDRLFGEVNNSAIGSAGAVGEDRLNLPVSDTSFGETDILDPVIRDSFESSADFSTPRQKGRAQIEIAPTQSQILSTESLGSPRDNTRSVLLGIGSQSLGGTSSIFGNLNMTSRTAGNISTQSLASDLATSKRKPAYDTSDEFDSSGTRAKPSMKRLKSQAEAALGADGDEEADDHYLFASVPPLVKNESGRQIDNPLPKTTFWESSNKKSWHLNYPEMTHLQYNAFERAAEKRGEEFGPGKSPLWDLAMRYFPPTHHRTHPDENRRPLELRPALLQRDSRSLERDSEWDLPPTAPFPTSDDDDEDAQSIPDTLPPESQALPVPTGRRTPKAVVARFRSAPDSLVPGVSFDLTDPILSWGREHHNTIVHQPMTELKVPKNAFRVLLWRDEYTASGPEFRPWEYTPTTFSRTVRASPDPDSFAFYISTKATNGLRINNNPLQPNNPKESDVACKYWMKLHHGDTIAFWGSADVNKQAKLTFECYWGSSSVSRPPDEPPTCVPGDMARKLDRLWPKALNNLSYDRIKTEAHIDHDLRMFNVAKEQERSRVFEQKRAEAVRILALRASRGPSPAARANSVPPHVPKMATMRPGRTTTPAL